MVAALLRVIHSGAQDSRLLYSKGNPDLALFKTVLIRAGRFTTQWTRLDFNTRPLIGTAAVITLPRKGHLISRLYLVTTMPDISTPQAAARQEADASGVTFVGPTFGWTNSVGHAIVQQATIEIGGSRVEQIDGRLLEVLDEFTTPLEKVSLTDSLLNRNSSSFTVGSFGLNSVTTAVTPLPFWFAQGDPGTFLPVDAIQADEVRLTITFAALNTLYVSTARQAVAVGTIPAGGDAYFPLAGSPFYYADPNGKMVYGLNGDPTQGQLVSTLGNRIPVTPVLGDTYIMAEYIYLDKPEANRFRVSDIQVPITQHYAFDPVDTKGITPVNCYLKIPNPTRNLYFYLQRFEAPYYNAPFLATRDLSGQGTTVPWWPNASQIGTRVHQELVPAFAFRNSEPLSGITLLYEGKFTRYSTTAPSFFRSLLPSFEQRKSPWVNRYYYNLPFALGSGKLPPSLHCGEANLDKIVNVNLNLDLHPRAGYADAMNVPRYLVYCWAETYNILRVYGGRAGMMFQY